MHAILLTVHTLIVLGLIVVVLLQRSDGGALGLGGGGGGFMSGRGAANALTRTTSILAAIFISTSLGLAILAGTGENEDSVIQDLTTQDIIDAAPASDDGEGLSTGDILSTIGGNADEEAPADEAAGADALDSIGTDDGAVEAETPLQAEQPAVETETGETAEEGGEDTPETEQPNQ